MFNICVAGSPISLYTSYAANSSFAGLPTNGSFQPTPLHEDALHRTQHQAQSLSTYFPNSNTTAAFNSLIYNTAQDIGSQDSAITVRASSNPPFPRTVEPPSPEHHITRRSKTSVASQSFCPSLTAENSGCVTSTKPSFNLLPPDKNFIIPNGVVTYATGQNRRSDNLAPQLIRSPGLESTVEESSNKSTVGSGSSVKTESIVVTTGAETFQYSLDEYKSEPVLTRETGKSIV